MEKEITEDENLDEVLADAVPVVIGMPSEPAKFDGSGEPGDPLWYVRTQPGPNDGSAFTDDGRTPTGEPILYDSGSETENPVLVAPDQAAPAEVTEDEAEFADADSDGFLDEVDEADVAAWNEAEDEEADDVGPSDALESAPVVTNDPDFDPADDDDDEVA